jgi:fumarate hydratase class II
MEKNRTESDSMGPMMIPAGCLYGASTRRAVENFPVSGWRFCRDFIRAFGAVKFFCAQVNERFGKLERGLSSAIQTAARDVELGVYDEQFVVDVFQTGSGTSTNMNLNEVIANVANVALGSRLGERAPVHPNDHVNMGQSSNDVFPTVIHVAAALLSHEKLIPALKDLESALAAKAAAFESVVKIGRTHLQDATPLTLGQEFSGYATQVKNGVLRLESALSGIYQLAIGGTAVGTGINTHPLFGREVADCLSKHFALPFCEAPNHFEAQASKDACVELSGSLKTIAISFTKIANDIRWLASGPRAGLGEISLPAVQPGSSIMPGKVNPVMPEVLLQVCAQVIANDCAISLGAQAGNFELNTMMPLIAYNLTNSILLLASASGLFTEKCVKGIEANHAKLQDNAERSLMQATALVPKIGYDKAVEIVKIAFAQNLSIKEALRTPAAIKLLGKVSFLLD